MGTTTLQYSIPPTYANEFTKKKNKEIIEKTLFYLIYIGGLGKGGKCY